MLWKTSNVCRYKGVIPKGIQWKYVNVWAQLGKFYYIKFPSKSDYGIFSLNNFSENIKVWGKNFFCVTPYNTVEVKTVPYKRNHAFLFNISKKVEDFQF